MAENTEVYPCTLIHVLTFDIISFASFTVFVNTSAILLVGAEIEMVQNYTDW